MILPVTLTNNLRSTNILALIDTGANVPAISANFVQQNNLTIINRQININVATTATKTKGMLKHPTTIKLSNKTVLLETILITME